MVKYDGYILEPIIRQLRLDRHYTFEQVSELTGLSVSSIQQIEQGGRNLSMKSLYLFMDSYKCDANSLLNLILNHQQFPGRTQLINC
jgi:transcriptional regulator with XRE-family HTH domain